MIWILLTFFPMIAVLVIRVDAIYRVLIEIRDMNARR
jgi:hypothetical protein